MGDSRYRQNGTVFVGNGYKHRQYQPIDSPLYHGWEPVMAYPDTDCRLWQLEHTDEMVKMRRVRPEDPMEAQKDDWVVFFKEMVFASYSGSLQEITASVREAWGKLTSKSIIQEKGEQRGRKETASTG